MKTIITFLLLGAVFTGVAQDSTQLKKPFVFLEKEIGWRHQNPWGLSVLTLRASNRALFAGRNGKWKKEQASLCAFGWGLLIM